MLYGVVLCTEELKSAAHYGLAFLLYTNAYCTSMYWAVTIVTTTGYGDILSETEFEKCKSCWFRNGNKATHGYAESSEGVSGRLAPSVCMYVLSHDSSKSVALGTHDRSLGGKH